MSQDLLVTQGTLLAAGPDMLDPNFRQTVVLICQHAKEGAYGLILNRPTGRNCRALFKDHPLLGDKDFPVYQGGPVGLDTLQILHRVPEIITGGAQIGADLYIGGDLEAAGRYAQERSEDALRTMRFLVGYSGWSPGQLEFELENGAWLPAHAEAELLFSERAEAMWKSVLRGLGGSVPGLQQEPPDPSWN